MLCIDEEPGSSLHYMTPFKTHLLLLLLRLGGALGDIRGEPPKLPERRYDCRGVLLPVLPAGAAACCW